MCDSGIISEKIVKLGTRSFNQRIEGLKPGGLNSYKLSRLNKDLDDFYEFIYDQFGDITEKDYAFFGPQYRMMLEEIKTLIKSGDKKYMENSVKNQLNKLKNVYSALYEINSDILNFKIKAKKDPEIQSLMSKAAEVSRKFAI